MMPAELQTAQAGEVGPGKSAPRPSLLPRPAVDQGHTATAIAPESPRQLFSPWRASRPAPGPLAP